MNNEEMERKMEFIVEQQAQFASKIGQLEDIVTRLATGSLRRFEENEEKTAQRFEDLDEKIAALVDSQIRLNEAQAVTSENLNNLIAVVDRCFSEGRNGKSQS
jgi:hypothetical protein